MATIESQQSPDDFSQDELDECPNCGRSAMSEDTPCSRCQPPHPNDTEPEDYSDDQCQNCGSHVSDRFRLVFGDNQNTAHACPNCHERNGSFPHRVAGNDFSGIQVIQR